MTDDNERREARRHQIEVPIQFDRGQGLSRDISLSGIYFTTNAPLEMGEQFSFTFELSYAIPGRSLQLDCRGRVLRVEKIDNSFGIAAKIDAITYLH